MPRLEIAKIVSKHAFLRKHQPPKQGYLNIADEIIALLDKGDEYVRSARPKRGGNGA